jgi:hypothetical protein
MRRRSNATIESLRDVFNGSTIRAMAGVQDHGEVRLVHVRADDGGEHIDTDGDKDAWISTEDVASGFAGMAALHIPGNILFSMPEPDDVALELRPATLGGPGVSFLLHGNGGTEDHWPDWVREKHGLFTWKPLRLESKLESVEIVCNEDDKHVAIIAGNTTATLTKDGDVVMDANGTVITIANNGEITIDAGGNNVNIKGDNVIMKEGSTPVAKEGSKTRGHMHGGSGMTAGPYPVSGNTEEESDEIDSGEGSANIKVP